jgi:hypothetical protein
LAELPASRCIQALSYIGYPGGEYKLIRPSEGKSPPCAGLRRQKWLRRQKYVFAAIDRLAREG